MRHFNDRCFPYLGSLQRHGGIWLWPLLRLSCRPGRRHRRTSPVDRERLGGAAPEKLLDLLAEFGIETGGGWLDLPRRQARSRPGVGWPDGRPRLRSRSRRARRG